MRELTRVQGMVLGKLIEQGLTLDATEDEMKEAFAGCVAPTKCLRIAKEVAALAKARGEAR